MLLFVLLFCLFLFFFNCDIVALQYSISFCCAAKWISCVYVCPLLLGHTFLASHPTPLGHHGAQSRAPCAVLTIYLHRAVCVHHWYSLSYSHPPQSVLIPVISVSYCFTNYFEIWPSSSCSASGRFSDCSEASGKEDTCSVHSVWSLTNI